MKMKLSLIIIFIFVFSCQKPPYTISPTIFTTENKVNSNYYDINSCINESGKGIVLFNNSIYEFENILSTGYKKTVNKNMGYSSISLNENGTGFIVYIDKESFNKKLITSINTIKIENFKYVNEKEYKINEIFTFPPIVKVNNEGTGFISWDTYNENKNININKFSLGENINTQKINYSSFLSYINSEDTTKINQIDLKELKNVYNDIKLLSDKYVDTVLLTKDSGDFTVASIINNEIGFPVKNDLYTKTIPTFPATHKKHFFIKLNKPIQKVDSSVQKKSGVIVIGDIALSSYYLYDNLDKSLLDRFTRDIFNDEIININLSINKKGDGVLFWVETENSTQKIIVKSTRIKDYDVQGTYLKDNFDEVMAF